MPADFPATAPAVDAPYSRTIALVIGGGAALVFLLLVTYLLPHAMAH